MKKIIVIGTGGLAREFTAWFKGDFEIVGYSSTNRTEHASFGLPGKLFAESITPGSAGTDLAVVAIGSPAAKKTNYEKYKDLGFLFPTIVHSSSVISDSAKLSDGVVISPRCVISPNVSIGRLTYVNFCCGVGHDVTLGAYVQINPGAQLGGFTAVGEQVLIGSGSTVRERVSIGALATIASGAVVFGKVAEGATVLGNPARRMRAFEKR
jgi:sugar O-acyltransferase (sialic acid O-acetyltransferase NeuD family)